MIGEIQSADLAARTRYASNLFDFIRERIEEQIETKMRDLSPITISPGDSENSFRLHSASRTIEVEANDPEGCVALKYIPTRDMAQSGIAELSDCRYPWDCKVSLKGCEWLGLDARESEGAPSPSLNERGEQIAAAIISKFFNP